MTAASAGIVAALFVYPIKSAAGTSVTELPLDERGAVGDRRWMVVDPAGIAITQRERHRLALVHPTFVSDDREGTLELRCSGLPALRVQPPRKGIERAVQIWDDSVRSLDAGDDAAAWMSEAIGSACRLVHIAPGAPRPLARKYAGALSPEHRNVAFSDGAPLLVLGQPSLDALNTKLDVAGQDAVPVARFRPNVLLEGIDPHEEDTWLLVHIGSVEMGIGSACPRCVITTIDQGTAVGGVEPLRTLATYRKQGSGVMFGMNATNADAGTLRIGDRVQVVRYK